MRWIKAGLDWQQAINYFTDYPLVKQAFRALEEEAWEFVRDDSNGDLPNLTFKKNDMKHNLRAESYTEGSWAWKMDGENFCMEVLDSGQLKETNIPTRTYPEADGIIQKRLLVLTRGL